MFILPVLASAALCSTPEPEVPFQLWAAQAVSTAELGGRGRCRRVILCFEPKHLQAVVAVKVQCFSEMLMWNMVFCHLRTVVNLQWEGGVGLIISESNFLPKCIQVWFLFGRQIVAEDFLMPVLDVFHFHRFSWILHMTVQICSLGVIEFWGQNN